MWSRLSMLAKIATLGMFATACGGSSERSEPAPVRIVSASVSMDCEFSLPHTGARTRVVVRYSNLGEASRVWRVESGRVELSGDGEHATQIFPLAPDTSGVLMPGETLEVEHERPLGTNSGAQNACKVCGDTSAWELFVTVSSADGQEELYAGSHELHCFG